MNERQEEKKEEKAEELLTLYQYPFTLLMYYSCALLPHLPTYLHGKPAYISAYTFECTFCVLSALLFHERGFLEVRGRHGAKWRGFFCGSRRSFSSRREPWKFLSRIKTTNLCRLFDDVVKCISCTCPDGQEQTSLFISFANLLVLKSYICVANQPAILSTNLWRKRYFRTKVGFLILAVASWFGDSKIGV